MNTYYISNCLILLLVGSNLHKQVKIIKLENKIKEIQYTRYKK